MIALWRAALAHYRPLIEKIIARPSVACSGRGGPPHEKIVSLFEPHADIIVKGGRDTQYGHKLNLVTGRSGLILDLVIEAGNPADSERFLPMLERHIAFHGQAPRQTAADGGYATAQSRRSQGSWRLDIAFHKKAGLRVEDMVKSRWVYRKLRNFRAGIEAGISCLKRAYGLARCLGADWTTSRPMSGPRSSPTIWLSSPASGLPESRPSPELSQTPLTAGPSDMRRVLRPSSPK